MVISVITFLKMHVFYSRPNFWNICQEENAVVYDFFFCPMNWLFLAAFISIITVILAANLPKIILFQNLKAPKSKGSLCLKKLNQNKCFWFVLRGKIRVS